MRITMDNLIDQNTKRRVDVDIEMAVLALCATFYGLGYQHGQHDSKTQK